MNAAVLCIGNLLAADDGFGPRVAEELLASQRTGAFPSEVAVLERAVIGMALLTDLRAYEQLLLIDAVDGTGQPAGTLMSFTADELAHASIWRGAHDVNLADVLAAAALIDCMPKLECLGVQVEEIARSEAKIGLSPALEAALPAVLLYASGWANNHISINMLRFDDK